MRKALLLAALYVISQQPACPEDLDRDPQEQIITFYTPFDKGAGEQAVLALIDQAHHEIKGNAYGLTDPAFCDALIRAHKRGVDVCFTIDSTQAAGPHQSPLLQELEGAGIDIQIGKSPSHSQLLHLKGFEVDQSVVEDGSWNYSPSASQQFNFIDIISSEKRAKLFLQCWQQIYDHIAPGGPHTTQNLESTSPHQIRKHPRRSLQDSE